ncbi:MAG: hypothetical protein AVDCRST_MAG79-2370 [uncultured Thermoleophilia bacterium]|uniref:Antitoxin n=1 Tax=uncultured Thermoleophilia bacterium TaxID=1497501 RepID=A0A6J4UGM4_9ACTN|nr:MAG: hypothetical protein AVDCRST_MAG79-2370 [uncultured Thermoleophilia bacterium]
MDTISQREMRNSSGAILRRVAAGETLLITNGGVPAAILSPVPRTVRDELVLAGRLRPAAAALDLAVLPPRIAPAVSTEEILADDRDGR